MTYRLPWRALASCVQAVAILSATTAHAAEEFAVTAAQMQALGVRLQRLEQPAQIDGLTYPARVVLPPQQEYVVSAPVAGVVDQLLVGENDTVEANQSLLRMVSPDLGELQLKLLEAASKSRLAQQKLQRERQLLREGIIPERRVQEAAAAAAEDQARLRQAEEAMRLAGFDAAAIRQVAQGGAAQSALMLRARGAGVVANLEVRPGQRVQQADTLVRIVDTSKLWLDIQIPVDRQARVAGKGGQVTVVNRDVAATLTSFGGTVSDSQNVTWRAEVTRGVQSLRPGEFVQARVPFSNSVEGWPVPVAAMVRQGDQAYVFLRTEKGFAARPVTVLDSAGQSVRVQGDLQAGQEIATSSVIALKAAWQGKGGSN